MITKKAKSKNRAKPPKATEDPLKEVPAENKVVTTEIEHREVLSEEPNIESSEKISENIPVIEEEKQLSDIPKKPKRKKVKKKQDVLIKENEPLITDDLIKEVSNKAQENEKNENKTEEVLNIVPATRKKKQKSNKSTDQNKTVELSQVLPENTEKTIEVNKLEVDDNKHVENKQTKTPEADRKDIAIPKKKKKKKHRHDSEKSDTNDPCTLAFQKLLKASDADSENNDAVDVAVKEQEIDDSITETLKESKDTQESKDTMDDCLKNKRKNKKGKKHLETEPMVKVESEEQTISSNVIKPDITLIETLEIETRELSPKPKAKIAKPVKKKSKSIQEITPNTQMYTKSSKLDTIDNIFEESKEEVKTQNKETETSLESITSPITPTIQPNDLYKGNTEEVLANTGIVQDSNHGSDLKNITLSEQVEIAPTNLENIDNFVETPDNKLVTEEQIEEHPKESDNSGFIEVKSGRNKKKRLQSSEILPEVEEAQESIEVKKENKSSSHHEENSEIFYSIPQLDIKENVKPEELVGLKVATPDLIQYPRSTSQLNIDGNNNTVIQEITTPDETKLGIPIYMPTPIIQGSGESPDVKPIIEPISTIKFSTNEPQLIKDSNEKTDIKSKMFEVNKEMEELRRSIERSLAELTGTEKCDSEVDKQFDEIFQSQIKESLKLTSVGDKPNVQTLESNNEIEKQDHKINEPEKKTPEKINIENQNTDSEDAIKKQNEKYDVKNNAPECPARSKSKSKSKRKGKKEPTPASTSSSSTSGIQEKYETNKEPSKESKEDKPEQKSSQGSSEEKGKQQSSDAANNVETSQSLKLDLSFEPIENFEDALTSSVDDVNKTFEIIANEAIEVSTSKLYQNNPQINVIAPSEDVEEGTKNDHKCENPISQPKNLLGHPNIPVSSNKTDYKKEKNKPPSSIQAKVKIKDSVEIEKEPAKSADVDKKLIRETNGHDGYSYSNTNDEFIYKYNFRKVFLQSACHVCKKSLIQRVPCKFCNLVFYCSEKHKDEDWSKHQSLCFAVSTIAHLKEQKHIYADAKNVTGHDYRVLRMQMIISCEKILKRKLVPWEQEALLYPRICADVSCREWKQSRLKDCEGCNQISYCTKQPDHLPTNHQRWCKSYALYQKLVNYQQTKGRLEPKLPTRVLTHYRIPDSLNQVLGSMYEGKIDMDDIQYAALTQIATGPLTAAYSYQQYTTKHTTNTNGISKKSNITVHLIATDLQFEADVLNKWEIFFLHLFDVNDLRVVLVGTELNPSNLPLGLLGKIRLCENCRTNKRRVLFDFHEESYQDYYSKVDFVTPDIVCAFNPNIQRSTYSTEDKWQPTLNCILKLRVPFLITSYTINELNRDINRIKQCTNIDFNTITDIKHNPFCSVRPDRNFITDHEMPLLFKNYCFSVLCGV